ncbi:MAG: 4a-hydroxytetrahydrobiopterin dehydratase [Chitinophagaceae bacterium]
MKINFIPEKNFFPEEKPSLKKDWVEKGNKLYKKFQFKNFSEAFAFMTRVAIEAEKMDHHPLWTNVYNTVEIWLNTHDAGDIVTEKDKKLSAKIDSLLTSQ